MKTQKWNVVAKRWLTAVRQLGDENPILFIHDVGAGGLSNAMPELVHDGERGGKFDLRSILVMKKGCRH